MEIRKIEVDKHTADIDSRSIGFAFKPFDLIWTQYVTYSN